MSSSRATEGVLREIALHPPENPEGPDLRDAAEFLSAHFPSVSVKVAPPCYAAVPKELLARTAEALASSRVKDPSKEAQDFAPMFGEVDYERRTLLGKAKVGGIIYDGARFLNILLDAFGLERPSLESAHIVFTHRLVSTYSRDDLRHHLRMLVCGFPSIVSIPGISEAPAKPREYYILRQRLEAEGVGDLMLEDLKNSFRDRYIDPGDSDKVLEVAKGLALQAVVFHLTLEPFCEDPDCRLFNAHWQAELLRSQVRSGRLCERHSNLLRDLSAHPALRW